LRPSIEPGAEVNDKAIEWWGPQFGLKQVGKWEIAVQRDNTARFSPKDEGQWSLTIRYEEKSN
jgi:hypothetical protein